MPGIEQGVRPQRQGGSPVVFGDQAREEMASALRRAEVDRCAIDPVTETWPGADLADAYAVQLINVRRRQQAGERLCGFKVGLTSKTMQEMLGVDQPDYGHLLAPMVLSSGAEVARQALIAPRVEVETAFVLGAPLAGPGVTVTDVLRATEFVLPAIEVIDSRIADWKITLVDTVADNASSALVVLGTRPVPLASTDLRLTGAVLEVDGQVVDTGAGAAVLGHPALAVAWLANALAGYGVSFEEGQVILPGSCTRAVSVEAGSTVRAELSDIGAVAVRFC